MKFFDKGMNFLNENSAGIGTTIAATAVVVSTSTTHQARKEGAKNRQTKRLYKLHQGKISGVTYMREQTNDGRSSLMIAEDLTEFHLFAKVNKKENGESFKPEEYQIFENFLEQYNRDKKLNGTVFSLKKKTIDSQKFIGSRDLIASQSSLEKKENENPPFASLSYWGQKNIKNHSFHFLNKEKKEINEVVCFSQAVPEDTISTSQLVLPESYIIQPPPFRETPAGDFLIQFSTGLITICTFVLYKKIYSYFQDKKKDQKSKLLPESKSTASSYIDIVVAYNNKEINETQATNLLIYFYQVPKDKALFLLLGTEKRVAETQDQELRTE